MPVRGRLNPEQLDKVRRAVLFGSNTNLKVPIPSDAVWNGDCRGESRDFFFQKKISDSRFWKGKIHPTSRPMYSPDKERVARSVSILRSGNVMERWCVCISCIHNPSLNVFSFSFFKWIYRECFRLTVSKQAANYLQYSFSHIRPWFVNRDPIPNSKGIYLNAGMPPKSLF